MIWTVGLGRFNVPVYCKCPLYSNGRYTFSPYLTCTHNCHFCYGRSGWSDYWLKRKGTAISADLAQARKEYLRLKPRSEIEISTICDAFDLVLEKKHGIAQTFLSDIVPLRKNVFLTFVTKSNLIRDYVDLIPPKQAVVQITVESHGEKLRGSSPSASTYEQRKDCVRKLLDSGIAASIRIDPIIPSYDTKEDISKIIADFARLGVEHVTCSFVKLSPRLLYNVENKMGLELRELMYLKRANEYFVKDSIRRDLATEIRRQCSEDGLSFAMCREDIVPDTEGCFCDPFHLLKDYRPKGDNSIISLEEYR